jgi:hypothetical protein
MRAKPDRRERKMGRDAPSSRLADDPFCTQRNPRGFGDAAIDKVFSTLVKRKALLIRIEYTPLLNTTPEMSITEELAFGSL